MPLKLRAPRPGKTPNFEIRGTHRGPKGSFRVETSSGTSRRSDALKFLRAIQDCIDLHGQWPAPELKRDPGEPTFLTAAVAYMKATGNCDRNVKRVVKHFGETPLSKMTQAAIDTAAMELAPNVSPASRSVYVYTPVSAIMHHALGDACPAIKHTNGGKAKERVDFLWPDDAFAIIAAADEIDSEFGLYLRMLIFTGIRKSEGLNLLKADVRPEERAAWLRDSKNEDPRMLKLKQELIGPLFKHLEGHTGERLFRFNNGGHFHHLLLRATMAACGLECPKRRPNKWKRPTFRLGFVTFHTFRHTWATWMRRYGGADVEGLAATKNWRDPRSARRYAHVVSREEWDRVDDLPSSGKAWGKASNE
jgi:integrase